MLEINRCNHNYLFQTQIVFHGLRKLTLACLLAKSRQAPCRLQKLLGRAGLQMQAFGPAVPCGLAFQTAVSCYRYPGGTSFTRPVIHGLTITIRIRCFCRHSCLIVLDNVVALTQIFLHKGSSSALNAHVAAMIHGPLYDKKRSGLHSLHMVVRVKFLYLSSYCSYNRRHHPDKLD